MKMLCHIIVKLLIMLLSYTCLTETSKTIKLITYQKTTKRRVLWTMITHRDITWFD
jgi:hypothetical protein